eukprot:Skav227362  [mRNA]  locus=scaffold1121:102084:108812:- [translate_table: standard]
MDRRVVPQRGPCGCGDGSGGAQLDARQAKLKAYEQKASEAFDQTGSRVCRGLLLGTAVGLATASLAATSAVRCDGPETSFKDEAMVTPQVPAPPKGKQGSFGRIAVAMLCWSLFVSVIVGIAPYLYHFAPVFRVMAQLLGVKLGSTGPRDLRMLMEKENSPMAIVPGAARAARAARGCCYSEAGCRGSKVKYGELQPTAPMAKAKFSKIR